MRFLADESCDFAIVRALRTSGHDVLAVSEVKPAAPDREVIELGFSTGRILLTEDKDFGQLYFVARANSSGVIFFRFAASARMALADSAVRLIKQLGDRLEGKFVVVQPGRVRLSRNP